MAKRKVSSGKKEIKAQEPDEVIEEPKRLSKAAEWRRRTPPGFMIIHDMKAVMR
jgi:hypothetical protein